MKYFLLCVLPLLLFIVCIIAIYGLEVRLLIQKIRKKPKRPASKWNPLIHALALVGLLCIAWGYFVEPWRLQISTLTIHTDQLKDTSLRVVQISDLHCDLRTRLEPRLVEEINRLNPDLIVLTGDVLNHKDALPLLQTTLHSLHASIGKYAVRGNVDNRKFKGLPLFEGTGFIELSMDTLSLEKDGRPFGVCGIDHALGPSSIQALQHLVPDRFNILLFHTTDLVDYLGPFPVDLYLSGHTHGGQVALPFWGSLLAESVRHKQYESGLYRLGRMDLYVNRGIGMTDGWTPRVRFWARPEITVFDIVPQNRIIPGTKTD
jgi:predicted MPP superfamily phosphohydrolase